MEYMIDPPSGWQYDFPKRWNEFVNSDIETWLVSLGYPRKLIDDFGDYFYIRSWTVQ